MSMGDSLFLYYYLLVTVFFSYLCPPWIASRGSNGRRGQQSQDGRPFLPGGFKLTISQGSLLPLGSVLASHPGPVCDPGASVSPSRPPSLRGIRASLSPL